MLIAAGCAEPWQTFDGKRALEIPGNTYANSICFDRYNVAERAASRRRSLEREAQQQRGLEAVRAAAAAKREALRAPARPPAASTDSPEAHATFEALRQRAEADVSTDAERQHRPNWALEFEGKFAVLNPEHTGFLSLHATQAELMAWIDEQRREKYAGRAG